MQEKAPILKSTWCYSIFLFHFSTLQKLPILFLRIPVLQLKQEILIRSTPTYLRSIDDQTRSKYDQPTLYRRPRRCTPAQHTTCGERDHPRPFFNRLKILSRSPRPLRADPTSPAVFRPIYAHPGERPLISDSSIFPEREGAGVDRLSGVNGP